MSLVKLPVELLEKVSGGAGSSGGFLIEVWEYCPNCGAWLYGHVSDSSGYGMDFDYLVCKDCRYFSWDTYISGPYDDLHSSSLIRLDGQTERRMAMSISKIEKLSTEELEEVNGGVIRATGNYFALETTYEVIDDATGEVLKRFYDDPIRGIHREVDAIEYAVEHGVSPEFI